MKTTSNVKETSTREIAKNIFLHTSKMALKNTEDLAHTLYTYTVEVKEISLVDVTLDFTGGENIKIENQAGFVVQTTIKPMTSHIAAVIRAYDINWSTPCKIKLSKRSPSLADQQVFIKDESTRLQQDIQTAREQWAKFPLNVATHNEVLAHIRTTGTNFIDVDFPPTDKAICDPTQGQLFDRVVHWRRPREFMLPDPRQGLFEPQVFEKSIEPDDILQGQLGDCWFLCAASCLAENPGLIERLYLTKECNEEGIYRVKICKNGEWREVVVDDYFPCFPKGGPIFSRGHGNELWVLLLEKAYAKVHGGYKQIVGGVPSEAMMDLTGCPTVSFLFTDEKVQDMIRNGKLWKHLKRYDQEGYVMSGGTPGQDVWTEDGGPKDQKGGLVPGHAYSVIQAQEYQGVRLVQIRNPWGAFEWDGDWSDNSPLWTEEMIQAFNPILDEADGTFWMSFEDFTQQFNSLDVCRIASWDELRLRGRFIRYYDVNDPDNEVVVSKWIYGLEVPSKTHLIIGLHQEDERIEGTLPRRPYLDFGIALLKREPEGSVLHELKDFYSGRDTELECILEPGSYIVVPRTAGCSLRKPANVEPEHVKLLQDNNQPTDLFASTIGDIFRKFDLVISNTIDFKEFNGLYDVLGKKPLTEIEFKDQILAKYTSYKDGITLKGLNEWFIDQVKQVGEDTVFNWLDKLGYDRELYSVRSRLFNITFHSKTIEKDGEPLEIQIRDAIGTNLDNVVNREVLKQNGKDIERGEGFRIVEVESPGIYAWSYGIINESDHPINAKIDLSECRNMVFSTKQPSAKKLLQPKECHFMLHAQAGFGEFTKKVAHDVQHLPKKR